MNDSGAPLFQEASKSLSEIWRPTSGHFRFGNAKVAGAVLQSDELLPMIRLGREWIPHLQCPYYPYYEIYFIFLLNFHMRFLGAFQCATVAHWSRMVFSNGSTPEQLTALQLAQVMAASEVDQSHAFALLQEAKEFLQEH